MTRRGWLLFSVLLCALLAGCTGQQTEQTEGCQLYFAAGNGQNTGPAILSQPWNGTPETCTPEALLQALLAGPTQEDLLSPFPRGVTLVSLTIENKTAVVVLSEQYGGLTDMALTLADYCIVLTLTQLEEVESVEILPTGHSVSYRSHQVLTRDEALLFAMEDAGMLS